MTGREGGLNPYHPPGAPTAWGSFGGFFLVSENLDLLGDPIPDGFGRRGRPPHIPTQENRLKVRMLLAFDWNEERIGRALRISAPTLRKHYFRELKLADEARDALEASLIATTIREAHAGSASMMKMAIKLIDKHDASLAGSTFGERRVREPKRGKKEQALVDAKTPDESTPLGQLMAQRQSGKPN